MGSFCKSGSKTTTRTTDIPDYIKTPLKENLDRAADLVKEPYQTYDGPRIEGFSQDQLDAFQELGICKARVKLTLMRQCRGLRSSASNVTDCWRTDV